MWSVTVRARAAGAVSAAVVAAVLGGQAAATTTAHAAAPTSLKQAVTAYHHYVVTNVNDQITHTKALCTAVDHHHVSAAQLRYPRARIYYERIEPVAKTWGYLDTEIDGRWENPVTVRSKFIGFHRIEQLLWQNRTTTGAGPLCHGLVGHERDLARLVRHKSFTPVAIAAGATDLIDEAAVSKITGEEERYSNTDFVVFTANIEATQEVVRLFTPYLEAREDKAILSQISQSHAALMTLIDSYRRTPGYDDTGYVDYQAVHARARRALSGAANAYAEALASLSSAVSTPS